MYTGSLGAVSNKEDWIVSIALSADDGTPYSIAGAAIVVFVCDPDLPLTSLLAGSVADGTITISGDGFTMTWLFPAAKMNAICAGQYSVFCRIVSAGVTTQLLAAGVSIVEGGPTS